MTATSMDQVSGAKRQYVELFGSALTWNTYLKIALILVIAIALGLTGLCFWIVQQHASTKPLVIRIDEVGRAAAVQYDALTYSPREPELKFFLTQFVTLHYSRRRASVKEAFPRSLLFLDAPLAEALIAFDNRTRSIDKFISDASDEIDIEVNNVTLTELKTFPYKAAVDATKVFYTPGTFAERRRESFIVQLDFRVRESVPAKLIPYNPLGLTITYLREDVAFR